MSAKTTILASQTLKENKFWLNGVEQTFDNERLQNCLKECKFISFSCVNFVVMTFF